MFVRCAVVKVSEDNCGKLEEQNTILSNNTNVLKV